MILNISFRWVWISYLTKNVDISAPNLPERPDWRTLSPSTNHTSQIWDSFNSGARRNKYLIIQHHILILHTRHERILRQRTLPTSKLLISPHHLCLQCLHIRWQEAVQLELLPFMRRKGWAFVVKGRPKNIWALRFMWVGVGLYRCSWGLNN